MMENATDIVRSKKDFHHIHGVFLLDKSSGITSNRALQQVKHLFRAKKAGHTGSLDPLASGLLPICLGEATKFSRFLLEADKRYLVKMKLGVRTNTGDAEGETIAQSAVPILSLDALEAALQKFRGNIQQVPSMYSALKFHGQPLYKLARLGKEVERLARPISIYSLTLLNHSDDTLMLDVRCSKGTYIRTLVDDIGLDLGCGAHVVELRRTAVGSYTIDDAHTVSDLERLLVLENARESLLPIDSMMSDWPIVTMTSATAFYLRRGQSIIFPSAPTQGWVRLYTEQEFFGVGEIAEDGKIVPRRILQTT